MLLEPTSGRTQLGVYLPTFAVGARASLHERLVATAKQAEALGADALWAADHLYWARPCLESLTAMVAAASATDRIAVGTSVVQAPLRHTASFAKAVASAQVLSRGRVVLGLGVGAHEGEFRAAGVPYHDRGARFDRQLEQLAELWSPGERRWSQRPAPSTVPIWFGGSGAHVRRRVVRWGHGWTSAFLRPKALAEEASRLRDDLAAAGRNPNEVTIAATVPVHVGSAQEVDRPLEHLHRMYGLDRRLFLGHLVAGEVGRCVERVLRYRDAGVDHVAVVVPADDPSAHLDALLPALREALG